MAPSTGITIAATAVTTATLLAFLRWRPIRRSIWDYTPDAFPGARDVNTPYGSIRVYEFGPKTGRKVLLVHGISTTCQTLGPIAHGLVRHAGCRVLLFDLFGRGFSDGVGDLPHDARLYTTQMLLALASSPLSWSGYGAFDLLGYSMGGGVAVPFAAAFPHMLPSTILLAPAGPIRPERFGVAARFVFTSGIVPERLLAAITRRRLRQPIASATKDRSKSGKAQPKKTPPKVIGEVELAVAAVQAVERAVESAVQEAVDQTVVPIDDAVAEVADAQAAEAEERPPETGGTVLSTQVMRYVRWMLMHHDGFVPAFMSCVRDAPLMGQQAAWQTLAAAVQQKGDDRLPLCVVLGHHDKVVSALDYEEDVLPMLGGRSAVTWVIVPGGHEFPMTYSRSVLRAIYRFWGGMDEALAKLHEDEETEVAETKTKVVSSTYNGKKCGAAMVEAR
ncbi:alpha beta hydrolase family [Grosmannia clavigera kw1407]|uniref:Alpha beta hydrolase family n=1 Tax=Grosmannia clavigera (strain kw1407 / UAMH 11150) TaxID=655863 RepID=F0XHF6_GROCL|nr:alpha beta hydrolase family [Grosmannia clavigera kw1407]EFX02792.1 alpha beta hydrolase family [Grosmannia clavigera kw1407]